MSQKLKIRHMYIRCRLDFKDDNGFDGFSELRN